MDTGMPRGHRATAARSRRTIEARRYRRPWAPAPRRPG
jgi:hypothetical protein